MFISSKECLTCLSHLSYRDCWWVCWAADDKFRKHNRLTANHYKQNQLLLGLTMKITAIVNASVLVI